MSDTDGIYREGREDLVARVKAKLLEVHHPRKHAHYRLALLRL